MNNCWSVIGLFLVSMISITMSGQDCLNPEQLCFQQGNNENPGSTGNGPIQMGTFSCFEVENATMYQFETVAPGPIEIVVSQIDCLNAGDILFGNDVEVAVFQATDACDPTTYTELACETNDNFIEIDGLMAADSGEVYYILIDGSFDPTINIQEALCDYAVQIGGTAVEPVPPFSANPIYNVPFGNAVSLSAVGASSYEWVDDMNNFVDSIATPIVMPNDTTIYTVTGIVGGCELTAEVVVNVIFEILPFNIFTPNSDGINDSWEILQAELYPTMDIRVFSRWGQQVFRSTGYTNNSDQAWDGMNNGTPLPAGTYYYVIELNREGLDAPTLTGSVAIIY